MNIGKDFLEVMNSLNEELFDEYYSVMDGIPETEEFFADVSKVRDELDKDFDFSDEELGKIVLYFLGKKHGGTNNNDKV